VIQAVHAQSVVFIGVESVEDLLQGGLWRGPSGNTSTSELNFTGNRPERLLVRIGGMRSAGRMATSCNFQMESLEQRFKPEVQGTIEFAAVKVASTTATRARIKTIPGRTKLVLRGTADRDLLGTMAPTAAVREVADEYARQLLDEIASRLEKLAKSEPVGAVARS